MQAHSEALAKLAFDESKYLAAEAEVAEVQRPLIADRITDEHGLGVMQTERWQELARQLLDLGIIDRAEPERAFTN